MISKPLFIKVALSTVILAPICQFGWRKASATVTVFSSSLVFSNNEPPLAVRISFSISDEFLPISICAMAECSLSIGIIRALFSSANFIMISPAITKVSLLASKTFRPFFKAWAVGKHPTEPTKALMTTGFGAGYLATSKSPSIPLTNSTPGNSCRRFPISMFSPHATKEGLNSSIIGIALVRF